MFFFAFSMTCNDFPQVEREPGNMVSRVAWRYAPCGQKTGHETRAVPVTAGHGRARGKANAGRLEPWSPSYCGSCYNQKVIPMYTLLTISVMGVGRSHIVCYVGRMNDFLKIISWHISKYKYANKKLGSHLQNWRNYDNLNFVDGFQILPENPVLQLFIE